MGLFTLALLIVSILTIWLDPFKGGWLPRITGLLGITAVTPIALPLYLAFLIGDPNTSYAITGFITAFVIAIGGALGGHLFGLALVMGWRAINKNTKDDNQ